MPMTSETSGCLSVCCSDEAKAYHPTDKFTLQALKTKGRSFQSSWFKQFPGLVFVQSEESILHLL